MRNCRILVVDDDENLALLIGERLRAEAYVVRTASSAEEAYRVFLSFRPHVVLTDIGLGEQTGLDLLRRIRGHDRQIRTIYMTGDMDRYRSALSRERKLHHVEVLAKPFEGKQLVSVVSTQAHRRQRAA